ncbi:MAG: hypothetical protein GX591_12315 [Planctomycetes bacterium]|nr:hypothetical protein [Planctomycetota bacterium]
MRSILRRGKGLLGRLHRDDRGAEGLEKLLILAAVVLPLLGLLIFFGKDIVEWVRDALDDVKGESEDLRNS